jgi:hypothetical protein
MRRLTVLLPAALLVMLGWVASAPGQLGEAARVDVPMVEPVPLTDGPPDLKEELGAPAQEEVVPTGSSGPHVAAKVLRRTALRATPGGKIVTGIGRRTRFGGPQVLAVVARRGRWLGVLHQWMPNGRAGWIDGEDAKLTEVRWAIDVDRSERMARVRHDGKVVHRFVVGVGRSGNETPVGRFAVTDRMLAAPGSPYGCCIFALTGRQTKLPSGWGGGDRLAVHGTSTGGVGAAISSGCLRANERDLRRMMRRVPLGARMTIRP